ncbi:MAG: NAD(P)/FAD-dependent oxidoreductase [Pseudomonadota bacterium]
MLLEISGITVFPGEGEVVLPDRAAAILGLPVGKIESFRVVRKSIDARRRRQPRFVYIVEVSLSHETVWTEKPAKGVTVRRLSQDEPPSFSKPRLKPALRPVVIGCGPAGLFAALALAESGMPPLLLERGKSVDKRVCDVNRFWEEGRLERESNVHFGEGGAGTFSDGKLTSRVNNPFTAWVKGVLVEMGAPADILTDARPHIGTDKLRAVVVRLREKLVELGAEIIFEARVTDFLMDRNRIIGVVVNHQEEIRTNHLILAIGQSADDTYRKLQERGVRLEPKPFAMGLRVEHPQELINEIQYGKWHRHPELPPADYFLTAGIEDMNRSVYSFCMCPGGRIICCSAEEGGVVTNGMSFSRRDGLYANCAAVVNVRMDDFGSGAPLAGLSFRRLWEARAFIDGGGNYHAPAQRLVDFMKDRDSDQIGPTSFRPGVRAASLQNSLPGFVTEALKKGFRQFDRKMTGFISTEAHLVGVETRTSSPVRISRGADGQSMNVAGLYPCGEGSGYAGGIISSALDGIRAARQID